LENKQLIDLALETAKNAYAPYSNFHVGAALLFDDGQVVTGCNVENASYGLSLCAERNALSTAVAKGIKAKVQKIAIVSLEADKCTPCGACRQWIQEIAPNAIVVLKDGESTVEYTISELLPHSFDKNMLG
jgi:cytidine deaminase